MAGGAVPPGEWSFRLAMPDQRLLLARPPGACPPAPTAGLWHHASFRNLWLGQTVSLFGSQITGLALPLTAALVLGASPSQMGLLFTLQAAPSLLVSLFAGVWVDRVRRRPVLIAADLGRALLLGSVPLAA